MKKFNYPEIKIEKFDIKDVISTSGGEPNFGKAVKKKKANSPIVRIGGGGAFPS